MKVKGLAWLGTRTHRREETSRFFAEVLGMRLERREGAVDVFELPDGAAVEVFGGEDRDHEFFTTGPVVGFAVDDVDAGRAELAATGIELLGEVQEGAGMKWCHFRGPDGNVYELTGK